MNVDNFDQIIVMMPISSSLTLVHVSPATNGAAVVVRERHAFVWETDGPDKRSLSHTLPVLLLQFDQNYETQMQH